MRPINEIGRKNLIAYLVENEISSTEPLVEQPDEVHSTIDEDSKNPFITDLKENSISGQADSETNDIVGGILMVTFLKEELAFMQEVTLLFGDTPRAINRFVNIYRIIKTHQNLKQENDQNISKLDYMPTLLTLSIVVGWPEISGLYISKIKTANEATLFGDFVLKMQLPKQFNDKLNQISEVSRIQIRYFKRNIDLISRFSFRVMI